MAIEMVHTCDSHAMVGERVPGAPIELAVGKVAGLVDLCESCTTALVVPLAELLVEAGRTAEGRPVRPRKAPAKSAVEHTGTVGLPAGMTLDEAQDLADAGKCPLDPACNPLKDRSAVGSHIRSFHGIAGGFDALGMGRRGRNQASRTDEFTCYDCDPPKPCKNAQGYGAHRVRVHGS